MGSARLGRMKGPGFSMKLVHRSPRSLSEPRGSLACRVVCVHGRSIVRERTRDSRVSLAVDPHPSCWCRNQLQ